MPPTIENLKQIRKITKKKALKTKCTFQDTRTKTQSINTH